MTKSMSQRVEEVFLPTVTFRNYTLRKQRIHGWQPDRSEDQAIARQLMREAKRTWSLTGWLSDEDLEAIGRVATENWGYSITTLDLEDEDD